MVNLFSAISIKNIAIRNRIVMPPMVIDWSDNSGIITKEHIKYYERRAMGECGLIILEAHSIRKVGRLSDKQLGIWADQHIDGLTKVADTCHKSGSKVLVQINHAGFKVPSSVSSNLYSATKCKYDSLGVKELTIAQIEEIQNQYVQAAIRARKACLDGIELHGAHGYLISQFISPLTNKRKDKYGGNIKNRIRFASEIIQMIKTEIADENFLIGYRMGGNEPTLEKGIEIARLLESEGIDILHVSSGMDGSDIPLLPEDFDFSWIVYCGVKIKKEVNIPVIVVKDIRTSRQAKYLVEHIMTDFVAVGRGYLADPDWGKKVKSGNKVIRYLDTSLFSI